ncbi:PTS system, glucose-specific IIA component [Terribacillus halophilus]|uniref:PTS system, glucose-specific IIA component n=1 Tax=Terribacillus halophilus TaxID=361279 RepID=A0A1G6J1B5_9BACI|nr:PTS glucose transporter subunit IIA [Terribacillus halophilus]SDC12642.1 PTS system, glucose-specific IIA component [Terribacillus halophilus]
MLKKLFGKSVTEEHFVSPVNGKAVPLEEVPDPVFAEKMMGDGIAIEPTDHTIVSPIDAEVVQVFETKHAIGLKTEMGLEVLLHIGLDTVNLKGEGFDTFVKTGDKVSAGDKLVTFDKAFVEANAKSCITPVIITNYEASEYTLEALFPEQAIAGETQIFQVKKK